MNSAEGEGERLRPGIEKLDLESAVAGAPLLADQLVESLAGDDAGALRVHVHAVIGAARLRGDSDTNSDPRATVICRRCAR